MLFSVMTSISYFYSFQILNSYKLGVAVAFNRKVSHYLGEIDLDVLAISGLWSLATMTYNFQMPGKAP